jgi:ABC-type multidrug transport system fused ATPase/permease subunit
VKVLVDTLSGGLYADGNVRNAWLGLVLLATLIAADNLLWRVASWIASYTFVAVTGDLRRDLFRHLTGHAPAYFAERMPGTLTSRITATSNAVYTLQNMFVWNVLPPCVATIVAIAFVVTVSAPMAAVLMVLAGILVLAIFRVWPPPAGRCITNSPTEPRRSRVKWWTSLATCRWYGRSAGWAANTAGLTQLLTGKWRRGGAACCIWRSCACSTPGSPYS